MQLMDRQSEQRLIKASESVIDEVNQGSAPTEALAKVARDLGFGPEQIRRVGEAYNTSRVMHHLGTTKGDDRHGTFPLANIDQAVDSVFSPANESIKSAAAPTESGSGINYFEQEKQTQKLRALRGDGHEKAASHPPRESPGRRAARAALVRREVESARSMAKQAAAEFEREVLDARDKLRASGTPFHELEIGARARHEKAGAELSNLLWSLIKGARLGHRRATPEEIDASRFTLMDLNQGGHATVERLVKRSLEFQARAAEYARAMERNEEFVPEGSTSTKEAAEKPVPFGSTASGSLDKYFTKKSFGPATTRVFNAIKNTLGGLDPQARYNQAVLEASRELQDPDLREGVRQIGVQTMLNDFLTNDPVISEYDPEEVVEYFNQLAQVAPDVADKPAVMRGLLRRSLQQGSIDVFEAGQVASISGDVAKNENDRTGETVERLIDENAKLDETMPMAGLTDETTQIFSALGGSPERGKNRAEQKLQLDRQKLQQSQNEARDRRQMAAEQFAATQQRARADADRSRADMDLRRQQMADQRIRDELEARRKATETYNQSVGEERDRFSRNPIEDYVATYERAFE